MVGSRLGQGIYTVPEASRLSRVSSQRIRRWLRGYWYATSLGPNRTPPIISGDFGDAGVLSFRDLIEVRFIDAFLRAGVSWRTIKVAQERARESLGTSHPFSSRRFRTDGGTILMETGEQELLDLVRNQMAFKAIVGPFLYRGLEFGDRDDVVRWRPMRNRKTVVLDPARSFGQPIVDREGVPTATLARAYRVEDSFAAVASWFEVSQVSVRVAVEFEETLKAA